LSGFGYGVTAGYTGLDTNVLLRYILRDDADQYAAAEAVFTSLTRECPGFITQVTLAEMYWVLSRSMKFSRAECLAVISKLVHAREFEFDDGESVVRALTLAEAGADFGDALIQGTMELFGVGRVVTFDRAAAQRLGWELLEASRNSSEPGALE